jgi:hypothetical protein
MEVYSAAPEKQIPPTPEEMREKAVDSVYVIGAGKGLSRDEVDKFVAEATKGKTIPDLSVADITAMKRKLQKLEVKSVGGY